MYLLYCFDATDAELWDSVISFSPSNSSDAYCTNPFCDQQHVRVDVHVHVDVYVDVIVDGFYLIEN